MGWFGYNIMDGDEPDDWLWNFYDILKVEPFDEKTNELTKITRKQIEKNLKLFVNSIEKEKKKYPKDVNTELLGYEVLGFLILKTKAAKVSKKLINTIIKATTKDLEENSNEFNEPSIRKRNLRNFIKRLEKLRDYK